MYNTSNSEVAIKARDKFQGFIEDGRTLSRGFFQRLEDEFPKDYIVGTGGLEFDVDSALNRIVVSSDGKSWLLHQNALSQMVEKTGILTGRVASKMFDAHSQDELWGRELLLHNLRTMYGKGSRDRVLVRVVHTPSQQEQGLPGEIRGFLSDRYRRLNTGPILQSFAEAAQKIGAVPMKNHRNYTATYYHDTRCGFSMFLPEVFEPVANEVLIIGMIVQSSDFGAAALTVRLVMLRIQCVNMMVTQDELRKVHLGARLPDDIRFSDDTYAKDTETMALAIRDTVNTLLGPDKVNAQMDAVKAMAEQSVDPVRVLGDLRRQGHLLKAEAEKIAKLYNTPDVELMPAGNTAWRAAQAISLFANQTQEEGNDGRAVELRHAAGALFDKFSTKKGTASAA